jgi:hypothetical protein
MPRGDKSKYTDKQKRQAEHIEKGYERKGLTEKESERRAWATVNKIHHGGERKGGGGYAKSDNKNVYKQAGQKGGHKSRKH